MDTGPTLWRLFFGLAALSAVFFVVERLLGNGRGKPVLRRGFFTDATYWLLTPLCTKPLVRLIFLVPIAALVASGLATADEFRAGTYAGFGPLSRQPLWLQAIEIYVLVDFLGYWSHRMFHSGRWWPFHAVHHSSEDLDWMASIRVHPVNELIGNLVRAAPVLLLGLNPLVTASTAPVFTLHAIFLHANVDWDFGPLRGVIASPIFHRWHHSREPAAIDKNFAGFFPVWDILFGTYYMPRHRRPVNVGIHEPMPSGYLRQFLHPFAAAFRWRGRAFAATAHPSKEFQLALLLTCTSGLQVCAQAPQRDFTPHCITLGRPGLGVYDGEVLSDPPAMVFNDSASGGSMWVARLDPKTGLFVTPTGRDQLVASDFTPLFRIFNGGEWGKDRDGAAVYFTKPKNGVDQIWMAPLKPTGDLTAVPLTSGDRKRGSPMPRRDASAASTQMLFIQDSYARGSLAVLDRKAPVASEKTMTGVDKGMSGPRFIPATPDLVYATTDGQIARFRTSTGDSIRLTKGGGRKGDPFAWSAPELGGATAVVAIEDMVRIVVYSLNPDGAGLKLVRTIDMPPPGDPQWKGENHPWIYSLEPFTAGGRSYFSLHAQRDRVPPPRSTGSSVWVVSYDPIEGEHLKRRLDDRTPAKRIDPEFLIGEKEVFVYFNVIERPWKMVRCTTGIPVGDNPTRDY